MKLNRETTNWYDSYGETTLVKDMSDVHVKNVVNFLKHYKTHSISTPEMIELFEEELKIRGLKEDEKQIPHEDPEGNIQIWDFDKHVNKKLE